MAAPLVTPISENWHAWGFIVEEASNGIFSRDPVTLASGNGVILAGTVLGALDSDAAAPVPVALGTNSAGNGTFGTVTNSTAAIPGNYTMEFDDATHFVVSNPAGVEIGHGVAGSAFSAGGLGFTFTAGGTAQVPGDMFTIPVVASAIKLATFDPTATNGLQNVAGILGSGRKDTTSADQKAVALVRGPAVVNLGELIWGVNVTTQAQKNAALAILQTAGIIGR